MKDERESARNMFFSCRIGMRRGNGFRVIEAADHVVFKAGRGAAAGGLHLGAVGSEKREAL